MPHAKISVIGQSSAGIFASFFPAAPAQAENDANQGSIIFLPLMTGKSESLTTHAELPKKLKKEFGERASFTMQKIEDVRMQQLPGLESVYSDLDRYADDCVEEIIRLNGDKLLLNSAPQTEEPKPPVIIVSFSLTFLLALNIVEKLKENYRMGNIHIVAIETTPVDYILRNRNPFEVFVNEDWLPIVKKELTPVQKDAILSLCDLLPAHKDDAVKIASIQHESQDEVDNESRALFNRVLANFSAEELGANYDTALVSISLLYALCQWFWQRYDTTSDRCQLNIAADIFARVTSINARSSVDEEYQTYRGRILDRQTATQEHHDYLAHLLPEDFDGDNRITPEHNAAILQHAGKLGWSEIGDERVTQIPVSDMLGLGDHVGILFDPQLIAPMARSIMRFQGITASSEEQNNDDLWLLSDDEDPYAEHDDRLFPDSSDDEVLAFGFGPR